jgi:CheY-like chemotaxis protein
VVQEKRLAGKTVLVVDDEPDLADILNEELVFEGAKVFQASNGKDGFQLFLTHKPDAVVTDVRMPGGDGIELLERIRSSDRPKTVTLLMTGFADISDEEAKAKGANAVIAKPFSLADFTDALKALLE